ncbi:F-box protein At3g07870-like [Juglans microcarpa x Juglans regia]|uniref:F-box protein At3g07870-like n=1 Tax=Juglans microcarpa x Juglans regia TaxID=2249226 RepID=UPI001B7DE800|nr:F-box protein At3g07870-like [Juglans microcarpa x Juglans regia]
MDSYLEKEDEKKIRSKLEGEEPSCKIDSLPRELILDILSRLPISSLIQLKSVCRAWRMLARHPDLMSIHSTRMAKNNPCLILHSDYPIRNQLYFVDIPADYNKEEKVKRFHVPFTAAMPEFNVVGSRKGSAKNFPSMQYSNLGEVVFGFGFDPTTKEYKVVKIVSYNINADRIYGRSLRVADMIPEAQVFSLGCSTWRIMGKLKYHLDQWSSQVLVNRRLHWVAWTRSYPRRTIVSFDLADEQFKEIRTPFKGCNYHCLSAAVYCNHGELEIWVMTEYDVEESWIKKFDIRNQHTQRS